MSIPVRQRQLPTNDGLHAVDLFSHRDCVFCLHLLPDEKQAEVGSKQEIHAQKEAINQAVLQERLLQRKTLLQHHSLGSFPWALVVDDLAARTLSWNEQLHSRGNRSCSCILRS